MACIRTKLVASMKRALFGGTTAKISRRTTAVASVKRAKIWNLRRVLF